MGVRPHHVTNTITRTKRVPSRESRGIARFSAIITEHETHTTLANYNYMRPSFQRAISTHVLVPYSRRNGQQHLQACIGHKDYSDRK
jgi:hypothetical protein